MKTVVILAGGASRRMGSDKLKLRFDGATLLESAVRRYGAFFDRVYLSLADASKYPEIKAERIVDRYHGCGPIAGLHSVLTTVRDDGVFLVAADMPFSSPEVAIRIMELCGDYDACMTTDSGGRLEPLFGYYKKAIAPVVEEQIVSGQYKLADFFGRIRIRVLSPSELGGLWSEDMLININRPEDYKKLTERF